MSLQNKVKGQSEGKIVTSGHAITLFCDHICAKFDAIERLMQTNFSERRTDEAIPSIPRTPTSLRGV